MKSKAILILFVLITAISSQFSLARINVYPFEDAALEKRFNQLVNELRCPKCQNNNLADSNSGLAKDLKDIVYDKVIAGESDKQIVDYLKQRYGDFVSYDPPMDSRTWIIWFGPFIMLALGLYGVIIYSKKRTVKAKVSAQLKISDDNKLMLSEWADETKMDNGDDSE